MVPQKWMQFSIPILLLMCFLGYGIYFYTTSLSDGKKVKSSEEAQISTIVAKKLSKFDGNVVTGEEALNALNDLADTKLNLYFLTINHRTNRTNSFCLPANENSITCKKVLWKDAITTDAPLSSISSLKLSRQTTNSFYVNPQESFESRVVKSESGKTEGIRFCQIKNSGSLCVESP